MDVAILRSANVVVAGLLAIALELTACQSFGPDRVPADQFNYNESIAESNRSQMPLKLVRICYRDAPVFLTVSSVLTQYIYSGSAGVSGTVGTSLGEPANAATGSTGLIYIERPTITYTRLSGGNFVNQLLRPISTDLVFSLVESGWPPEWLMMMMNLERLNHLTNLPFDTEPTPEVREQFGNFQRAVRLIIELARRNAIESRHSDDAKAAGDRVLVLDDSKDRQTRALVDEFKRLLILIVRVSSFVSRSGLHGASPIKSPSAFVRLSR